MKRRGHQSLAELLKAALPDARGRRAVPLSVVRTKWAEAVGRELGLRSEPSELKQGVLTVRVTDARWGQTIVRMQGKIVPRLNAALGVDAVRRIQFVRDGRPLAPSDPARPAGREDAAPPPCEPPAGVLEAARAIEEPELRQLVVDAASRYLAARERRRGGGS